MPEHPHLPDVLLLTGTHCPYCPSMLRALQTLLADGAIASLESVNIEENPELAAELGVRSVPWVRIGPFELAGLRPAQELRQWVQRAGSDAGMVNYLDELLSTGAIDKGLDLVRKEPAAMDALLTLFSDPELQLNVRIGISAIMEELEGSEPLQGLVGRLGELTRHDQAAIRGDACHFLALSGSREAAVFIRPLLDDPDAGIREIAADSLELLAAGE